MNLMYGHGLEVMSVNPGSNLGYVGLLSLVIFEPKITKRELATSTNLISS